MNNTQLVRLEILSRKASEIAAVDNSIETTIVTMGVVALKLAGYSENETEARLQKLERHVETLHTECVA